MAEEFNSLNDIFYEESKELITNFLNQDFNNLFSTPYNHILIIIRTFVPFDNYFMTQKKTLSFKIRSICLFSFSD